MFSDQQSSAEIVLRLLPPYSSLLKVRDEEGRTRFHGAFSGGFSAGYFNTVGWTPQTFTSSRKNRAEIKQQDLLNFLDDDEKAEPGCRSQWGHDFCPDYKNLGILKTQFPNATTTKKVRQKSSIGKLVIDEIADFIQNSSSINKSEIVKNSLEESEVIGITNYIDFGFELLTRVDNQKPSNNIHDSTFNIDACWQANKNILL
ncbi:hypothetical protein L2E82_11566 [Cichorium intybus]|uniref:Uncharacterized protein n=1 Tax=Cichorium intybus TaxID=13427 RepID=A0ACB9GDN9_CICIN|nr:hypothetical protein L2E82_11566 [Cichorium intybus]